MNILINISDEIYRHAKDISEDSNDEWNAMRAIANGIPFPEICDRENSEIKNEVKDLSKRVETLEKQMKEEKEAQLKKLKAEAEKLKEELDYAKFRCAFPVILRK